MAELGQGAKANRYKGLGEMNPRAAVGDHHEPLKTV